MVTCMYEKSMNAIWRKRYKPNCSGKLKNHLRDTWAPIVFILIIVKNFTKYVNIAIVQAILFLKNLFVLISKIFLKTTGMSNRNIISTSLAVYRHTKKHTSFYNHVFLAINALVRTSRINHSQENIIYNVLKVSIDRTGAFFYKLMKNAILKLFNKVRYKVTPQGLDRLYFSIMITCGVFTDKRTGNYLQKYQKMSKSSKVFVMIKNCQSQVIIRPFEIRRNVEITNSDYVRVQE
ncbi:hypothetical protein AGLY_002973 [Aphis glycines]|uniref:Uncharacterized protein n=1 Tax=Aphis glycines TaxID=307491 RepID=A0A6G0U451_APHGL|nr:hypothetical protein AGLY_002973 [Aphis glycines]